MSKSLEKTDRSETGLSKESLSAKLQAVSTTQSPLGLLTIQRAARNMAIQRLACQVEGSCLPHPGPATQAALRSSRNGRPLPDSVRGKMENNFRTDLKGVRLHADAQAAEAARELNAHAFTYGQDIYFANGRYSLTDNKGQRLLSHELAHTVQQQTASPSPHDTHLAVVPAGAAVEADQLVRLFVKPSHAMDRRAVRCLGPASPSPAQSKIFLQLMGRVFVIPF
jgi:hypothetical protein